MINEDARQYVVDAIEKEMNIAIENHGYFHNDHEFWAVLKEEIEELSGVFVLGKMGDRINDLWQEIRCDNKIETSRLEDIKFFALEMILEAVQVVAVIDKYIVGKEREKTNVNGKTKEG